MAQDSSNPFVLPGFGQQGDAAQNPLFAGLDMMRQTWQNMAGAGRLDAAATLPPMSIEDLDQRIRELQTVQNWLQLNASMLASTIQGLEIQRSTLATLKSFTGSAFPGTAGAASPADQSEASGQAVAQAAGEWWNMVQQQFEQLTAATAASLQDMADVAASPSDTRATAGKTAHKASTKSAAKKTPAKSATKKTPAKSTRKPRA